MNQYQKRFWQIVAFVWGVIALLAVVSALAPQEEVRVAGWPVRLPRLETFLSPEPQDSALSVEEQLANMDAELVMTAEDSARMAKADSLAFFEKFFTSSTSSICYPDSNFLYFAPLYESLARARTHSVHVMHYGDSQIEGDRITGLLRDSLQSLFGGSGPGVLPLWQPIPSRSVAQSLSDSVPTFFAGGMMGRRAPHNRYGAIAQVSELRNDSVVMKVEARATGGFRHVVLYVGQVQGHLSATLNDQTRLADPLDDGLQMLEWDMASCGTLRLAVAGSAEIYGLQVDGGRGVSVSNVPMRGSDGTYFTRQDGAMLSQMLRDLSTELIIMEFGGNAMPYIDNVAKVDNWCNSFGHQIDFMKRMCPHAKILVIGPADMANMRDGVLCSLPMLPTMTSAMKQMCNDHGVAFWDMFAVMGGKGSMVKWTQHQPAWAATDYVHFTSRGANRIAQVLWQAFRANYDYCQFVKSLEE